VCAVITGTLDGAQHGLGIVFRRSQPRADHAAGLLLGYAKADQDRDALAPEFVARIRIDRRASARTFRYGNNFLVFLVFYFASMLRRCRVGLCVVRCVGRK
jgi:hypothetical protein